MHSRPGLLSTLSAREHNTRELQKFVQAATRARALGVGVNAGHDLNLHNLPDFIREVAPDEVSIGHALIADAIWLGLDGATRLYIARCQGQ